MKALGLTIDSSVAPGTVLRTPSHAYDYRDAPSGACWRFDADPLQPTPLGHFVELPITCIRTLLATKIMCRAHRRIRRDAGRPFGDGAYFRPSAKRGIAPRTSPSCVTLEATPPWVFRRVLSHAPEVVTLISHPKAMSQMSFESLRWLAQQDVHFALPGEVVANHLGMCGDS
jgi:hypothetical protein